MDGSIEEMKVVQDWIFGMVQTLTGSIDYPDEQLMVVGLKLGNMRGVV